MDNQISNLQVKAFGQNFYTNVELMGGKLRKYVTMVGDKFGAIPYRKDGIYPIYQGGGRPQAKTTRYGDSPVSEGQYGNRKITRKFFHDGFFSDDWQDFEQIVADPKAPKTVGLANKFRREEDIGIMTGILGAANGGALGDTSVPFTTTNVIPVGTGSTGNTGMNYKKFLALKDALVTSNVDIEYGPKPVLVMGSQQYWIELHNDEKFINSGYYKFAQAAGSSRVIDFLDITVVVMNNTPFLNDAGNGVDVVSAWNATTGDAVDYTSGPKDIRACFAFMPDAVYHELGPDIETNSERVILKSNAIYTYAKMAFGTTRVEEAKCWLVPCDESP
jgi:hypothetical protein